MKMFSDCSGDCCVCSCGNFCLAGHGDDDFIPASKEEIIQRLKDNKYPSYKGYMKKYLLDKYDYTYEEK